jgi:predicted MPP superfamily phosphohydrolase
MILKVLHISDIHFCGDEEIAANQIRSVVGALKSETISADGYIVVLSGDVAYSGKQQEYASALGFLQNLKTEFSLYDDVAKLKIVAVPGNHDCNHSQPSHTREIVRASVFHKIRELQSDSDALRSLLAVQDDFFNFREGLGGKRLSSNVEKCCWTEDFLFANSVVQVHHYNTALMSQLEESQGFLQIPLQFADTNIQFRSDSALSIAVFHHPYNWIEANNQLRFRSFVESTADLVLTGHQHFESTFSKQNRTGERVLYFEALAFHDPKLPKNGFSVLTFDTQNRQYRIVQHVWNGLIYKTDSDTELRPFSRNEKVRNAFVNNEEFLSRLNDLGTGFIHRSGSKPNLRDVFVYPSLKVRSLGTGGAETRIESDEVVRFFANREAVIAIGASQSGKSSLAKMLYADLNLTSGVTPLLVDGRTITGASENTLFKTLWRSFRDQYSEDLLDKFKQLPKSERLVIVDDWHLAKISTKSQLQVLSMLKEFAKVILLADDLYAIQELVENANKSQELLSIDHATILPLGHVLTARLIERWELLGRERDLDEHKFYHQTDHLEKTVRALVGRGILPPYPFIVLTILQAYEQEQTAPSSAQIGSYGYLYQVLITRAFANVSEDVTDIDTLFTVMSRVAFRLFDNQQSSVTREGVIGLTREYFDLYEIHIDADKLLSDLVKQHILVEANGNYSFRYDYYYHYFVARYFGKSMESRIEAS